LTGGFATTSGGEKSNISGKAETEAARDHGQYPIIAVAAT
jgi:hypothetical protein